MRHAAVSRLLCSPCRVCFCHISILFKFGFLFPFYLRNIHFIHFFFLVLQLEYFNSKDLRKGALNCCQSSVTCHSSSTLHLFHRHDSAGEKQDHYSNACSRTIYIGWNKTIIFLLSIDLIDFGFSAQDLNPLIFFSD